MKVIGDGTVQQLTHSKTTNSLAMLPYVLEHSDSRFESIRRFVLGESIRFVKNSATQFGRYIRLINDHILMPIVPYSAVVYNSALLSCYNWRHSWRLCEVVRVTHDDGVELIFDNIVYDNSLYAYTAVMCWIESKKIDSFWKIKLEYFFWIGMLYYVHC